MAMLRIGALLLVSLIGFTAAVRAAQCPVEEEDRWVRVQTENFTVFSNAPDELAVDVGLGLESQRRILAGLHPDRPFNSTRPTVVYVFKSATAFDPFKSRYRGQAANFEGQMLQTRDSNLVGLGVQRSDHTYRLVYHELVHVFVAENMPGTPTWLDEGLAEYYSTLEYADGQVTLGRPLMHHVQTIATKGFLPLDQLLRITPGSAAYNEEQRQGIFYAQSWLMAHYFYNGHPELIPRLESFVDRTRSWSGSRSKHSIDPDLAFGAYAEQREREAAELLEAFRESFGVDEAQFRKQLTEYRRADEFTGSPISLADLKLDTKVDVAVLSRADYLTHLGDYLIRSREDEPELALACY